MKDNTCVEFLVLLFGTAWLGGLVLLVVVGLYLIGQLLK